MAKPVVESILVRRPVDEVAKVATDAHTVLPLLGGPGRVALIEGYADGSADWDLFVDVGTIHVGGRVHVQPSDGSTLALQSIRGTRQTARLDVQPEGECTRVSITVTIEFSGLLVAAITDRLARGIVRRNLTAGLEELRHQLEFGPA